MHTTRMRRLSLFNGEGGAGGGTGGQQQSTGGSSGQGEQFTAPQSQAELDRIIGDRLARERAKFADYDQLKTKAVELDNLQAQNATELDQAVAKARKEATAEADQRVAGVLRAAEIRALAAEAGFQNPADAVALLATDTRLAAVKVADGQVDVDALKPLVADLAKDRPYLVGQARQDDDEGQDGRRGGAWSGGYVPGAGTGDGRPAPPAPGIDTLRAGYAQSGGGRRR